MQPPKEKTMPMKPLWELAEDLAEGRTTSVALTTECFERIEDPNGEGSRAFIRLFKRETGQSPLRYLTEVKMEAARRLLEAGSLTIDAISDRLGFQNRFHFSRIFRKIVGEPPAAYRKAWQPLREGES